MTQHLAASIAPVVIWAAHFTLVYGFTGIACARRLDAAVPWVIGVASLVALCALIAIVAPVAARVVRNPRFPDYLAAGLGGLAAIAIVWEASSLLGTRSCG